ncbi:MAG: MFS transporter [Proteobacteria bacterium]|nr:MFS transporter [Pseudomonadota bacterium]
MKSNSTGIYKFIGIHSFLIGLFPFYLPVYLWKTGTSFSDISFFIALTGLGFCITLWVWDRLRRNITLKGFVLISFILEILLLAVVFLDKTPFAFLIFGLLNGAYNGLFWTTQRVLFFDTIQPSNSGKKFGNLQIIVALFLKSGIFLGGLTLDTLGFNSLFLFSTIIAGLGALSFFFSRQSASHSPELVQIKPTRLADILRFKDTHHSKPVFLLDGLFLYLESYFWMISMFLIVKESFWDLGLLVIGLMVLFTILFFIIKNSIDRLPKTLFFRFSILLYAASWWLRGSIDGDQSLVSLFVALVLISFFTSLFRLTFNKRFFDIAKSELRYHYLIQKSYYSQASIAIVFAVIGIITLNLNDPTTALQSIYFLAAFLTAGYTVYSVKMTGKTRLDSLSHDMNKTGKSSGKSMV